MTTAVADPPVYLWKFEWNLGRSGSVSGLFSATQAEVDTVIGREVYFGSILGKHSEVYGKVERNEITRLPLDPSVVAAVTQSLDDTTWCGYNPLEYLQEVDDTEEEGEWDDEWDDDEDDEDEDDEEEAE